jgi:RNA polymerase sigma factor (sigma-70 family)
MDMTLKSSDHQLLVAARDDMDAFGDFYERHAELVLRYFAGRVREPEAAADLMAETFAAALCAIDRYRPRAELALAWLFTIARNQLIDAHRRGQVRDKARRRLALERLWLDDDDITRIESMGGPLDVDELLTGLTPDEQAAVRARVLEELPYRDVATSLRCSEAVARKRVSRGLARARARLEGASR